MELSGLIPVIWFYTKLLWGCRFYTDYWRHNSFLYKLMIKFCEHLKIDFFLLFQLIYMHIVIQNFCLIGDRRFLFFFFIFEIQNLKNQCNFIFEKLSIKMLQKYLKLKISNKWKLKQRFCISKDALQFLTIKSKFKL